MLALYRRAREGGSWHVRLSLAQTGRWLESLGRPDGLDCPDPQADDVADLLETRESPFGKVTHVSSPIELSGKLGRLSTTLESPSIERTDDLRLVAHSTGPGIQVGERQSFRSLT